MGDRRQDPNSQLSAGELNGGSTRSFDIETLTGTGARLGGGDQTGGRYGNETEGDRGNSVVQHDAQQRVVDPEAAVVLDEAKLLELVHEEVDARAGRSDHSR